MRILLVTDALPDRPRGGLDRHVAELIVELERRGHEPALLPAGVPATESAIPGARLRATVASAEAEQALRDALQAFEPDAVHIHSLIASSARLPGLARAFGAAVVWTHHDLYAVCPRVHLHDGDGGACAGPDGGARCGPCHGGIKGFLGGPAFAMRHRAFAEALQLAHQHVAPSAWVAGVLEGEGVDAERIHVLPTAPPKALAPAGLPPEGEAPRLVVCGDLRAAKGADRAVAAFAAVVGRARLELWGGPPAAPAPREAAFEQALMGAAAPGVSFRGRYEPDDLDGILDGAAALVHVGRVREAFGRTANEALQRGVPVIAVDSGGLAEQVVDGVNGWLVPEGEGLVEALGAAMGRAVDEGILLQAEAPSWPRAPTLAEHVDGLEPLYEWRP